MATTEVRTYVDVVEHCLDWLGTTSADALMLRKIKRSVENAYRDFTSVRQWSYFQRIGRFVSDGYYNTGTVAYDHTGGSNERELTLTTGTWPTWAKYGFVRIDNVDYEVASRVSSSILVLSVNSNPGADIAAGETYEIFRDTYPLPVDLMAIGNVRDVSNRFDPEYAPPAAFMADRAAQEGAGHPRVFTIIGDQNYLSTMAIRLYPPPDDEYSYEFLYRRRPRALTLYQYNTGTVTTSGTTVTGSGTTFTSRMIGDVIRFGTSATVAPTGTTGSAPYFEHRVITSYTSATSISIDQALSSEQSGVKFEISSPIEIEAGAMYTAFLRKCELELAMMTRRDDVAKHAQQYAMAEILAKEADVRSYGDYANSTYRKVPLTWTVADG